MFGCVIGIRRLSLNFVIAHRFLSSYPSWNNKKYEIFSFHSLLYGCMYRVNLLMYNFWQLCPIYLEMIKHYGLLFIAVWAIFSSYPAAFTSEGCFSCQHLLRLRTSVYTVSSEGQAPMSHSGIRTRNSRIIRSLRLRTITLNLSFSCMRGKLWRWPHI
jgi:hypothetical protein